MEEITEEEDKLVAVFVDRKSREIKLRMSPDFKKRIKITKGWEWGGV